MRVNVPSTQVFNLSCFMFQAHSAQHESYRRSSAPSSVRMEKSSKNPGGSAHELKNPSFLIRNSPLCKGLRSDSPTPPPPARRNGLGFNAAHLHDAGTVENVRAVPWKRLHAFSLTIGFERRGIGRASASKFIARQIHIVMV
jgi:hypothetical protein